MLPNGGGRVLKTQQFYFFIINVGVFALLVHVPQILSEVYVANQHGVDVQSLNWSLTPSYTPFWVYGLGTKPS